MFSPISSCLIRSPREGKLVIPLKTISAHLQLQTNLPFRTRVAIEAATTIETY